MIRKKVFWDNYPDNSINESLDDLICLTLMDINIDSWYLKFQRSECTKLNNGKKYHINTYFSITALKEQSVFQN